METKTVNNKSDSDKTKEISIEMDITEKEIQSADIDRLIGRDKWKPFLKHSCYLILIIALILSIYITVYFVKQRAFRIAFRNFSKPGNGYDIAACLVLIICLFIPSYSPELGRKYKIAILPLLLLCILYLSAFLIRISIIISGVKKIWDNRAARKAEGDEKSET